MKKFIVLPAIVGLAVASISACGSDSKEETKTTPTATKTTSAAAGATESTKSATSTATKTGDSKSGDSKAAGGLMLHEGWVKATDGKMTGMFGELKNPGKTDIVLVSGKSESAGMIELHEVVTKDGKKVMQKVEKGFTIPAGGSLKLAPGQDHIMLMKMTKPVKAGDSVTVTLTDKAGKTYDVKGTAKAAAAGSEPYDKGHDHNHGDKKDSKDKDAKDKDSKGEDHKHDHSKPTTSETK